MQKALQRLYGRGPHLIKENKKAYKAADYPNAAGDTTKPEVLFGKQTQ